jgi:hypothetical protein
MAPERYRVQISYSSALHHSGVITASPYHLITFDAQRRYAQRLCVLERIGAHLADARVGLPNKSGSSTWLFARVPAPALIGFFVEA